MSVAEQGEIVTRPPAWVLPAIAAGAFVCLLTGALVVEPALHRLMRGPVPSRPVLQTLAASDGIEAGDTLLSGLYRAEDGALTLNIDGSRITRHDPRADAGRLLTAPHRRVQADQAASANRSFVQAMDIPAATRVEVLRVVEDRASRLCGGAPVGWLALAIDKDGFHLLPVRQGPPPGTLAADDRLCAMSILKQ